MSDTTRWYQRKLFLEIIFSVTIFLLTMVQQWIEINTFAGFLKGLVFFLIAYGQAQVYRFFVFPLLMQRRYVVYAVVSLVVLSIGALGTYWVGDYWIAPEHRESFWVDILYYFAFSVTGTITVMGFFLTHQYYTEIEKREKDQMLLNEMHIKLLHAQLNPHFFFNMLNNLYGVSLTSPERTPDLIMKLSQMMRYQLESGNKQTVLVGNELNFINNYIVMEKERVGKRCEVTFIQPDAREQLALYAISPLILITLVENAFKHSLTISRKWFVNIRIDLRENTLSMHIVNSLPDQSMQKESMGMGLQNMQQRLELLYRERYQFETTTGENEFQTQLTLKLNRA